MSLLTLGGLGTFVSNTWMAICIALNWMVYSVIGILYEVFNAISNINLFNKEIFEGFTQRMYVVIGVAMLFIFAYNLILMIINPEDKKSTGQMSKVVKETIISLVLVILLPTLFNYMAIFQKHIIDSNIISKIILGTTTGSENTACNFDEYKSLEVSGLKLDVLKAECNDFYGAPASVRGARILTPTLLNAFLYPTQFDFNTCEEFIKSCNGSDLKSCSSQGVEDVSDSKYSNKELCGQFYYNIKMSEYTGSAKYILYNSYFSDVLKDDNGKILSFNYVLAIIGGVLAIIMFASYTIMIGVRVAKLGFLEMIAPIPVMMRIIPKQKEALFDKWLKELKNTYLDVFVRLVIINFALYSVTLVPGIFDQLKLQGEYNIAVMLLAKAVVILGILQFAKETPSLIKEFFGDSGRFGLKAGFDKWKTNPLTNAARASVYGATTGKGFGKVTGAFSGAARGMVGGYDKAVKGLDTSRTERENGSSLPGRMLDRARIISGMETRGDRDDRQVNRWSEKLKTSREDEKKLKSIKDMATNAITKDTSKIKFNGFQFDGVDFSNMKYTQVKEYENVLKSAYENAKEVKDDNGIVVKTQEQVKNEAYQKLIQFQNEFGKAMKLKTEEAVDALIKGEDFYNAFTASDYSTASSNLAEVRSNDHDGIDKISSYSEFDKAINTLGDNNKKLSEDISTVTTKKGYQARKADNRMVKNQGESKKK